MKDSGETYAGMKIFTDENVPSGRVTFVPPELKCDDCGGELAWYPSNRHRMALFCSSECGNKKDYTVE